MKKRKKGSLTDLTWIIAGIFSVALVALLVTYIVNNLNTTVQDNDIFPSNAKSASTKMKDSFPAVMDSGVVFIFFAAVIASLILASLVPIHPIFFPFYLIELFLLIWLGAGIANAYETLTEMSILATEAAQFTLTTHFFRYFPFVIGVVGILLAIVMYKVKKGITEG